MKQYDFKATRLICDALEEREVPYCLQKRESPLGSSEEIWVPIQITLGPSVQLRYIIRDDDNDTAVRIQGLLTKVPKEKRSRVLEACAAINGDYEGNRYLKFCMDDDGDINVEFDTPVETPDESVGLVAYEIYEQSNAILERQFPIIATAFYCGDPICVAVPGEDQEPEMIMDDMFGGLDLETMFADEFDEHDGNNGDIEF